MMTKHELSQALAIARSDTELYLGDLEPFDGFALRDFQPIHCTVEALAMLIRWQCVQFNGGIDHEALQEIARIGRHKFRVLSAETVGAPC